MSEYHTLYLCYFGLREPLVQTQVLPYLRQISDGGVKVSILTFEPNPKQNWTKEQIESEREKLLSENIRWDFLTYHKRPSAPATIYDIFRGAWFIRRMMKREKIDILHARAHVPTIMGLLAKKVSADKPKLLFDIRGFVPEEYTDAGIWKKDGLIYKVFKRAEKWILKKSDGFVVLTEKARTILFPESAEKGVDKFGRFVEVIPCCVDLKKRFQGNRITMREEMRHQLNVNNRFVITHLGALGGLYLTEDIANFLQTAKSKDPSTFALFLTQTNPDLIIPLLKERGFLEEDFFVGKISPTEVQRYLSACDIALSFVQATYSTTSRSPTKIAEYLAGGLPVISNAGVGDVDSLIEGEKVGVILNGFEENDYLAALEKLAALRANEDLSEHCRRTAFEQFDLETIAGERYRRIYRRLLD